MVQALTAADRHAAVAWLVQQVPRGRRVVHARRLTGGLTSEVTAVTVADAAGALHRLVLRRWTGEPWPDGAVDDGRELVPREAAVLTALARTGLRAPRLVATDPTGAAAGLPALVMTRVPGRLELTPADPDAWTRRLAEQLAAIHAVAPWRGLAAYEPWLRTPSAPMRGRRWQRALEVIDRAPPALPATLVHHDFQQFNVLWQRGRISGVVDWVWASAGPPDADVVHCRLNLCLLYGADRAVAFQEAYEALAGRRVDPWWDVAGVVDGLAWDAAELQKQAAGRLHVDRDRFRGRLDALLGWVLDRPAVTV